MHEFQVSYFNDRTRLRHVLIDRIDEHTADKVVARFGDKGDALHRLPEVRKEPMPATESAS